MKSIFENNWIEISLDPQRSLVVSEWKPNGRRVISFEEFQEVFNKVLETLKDYEAKQWSDDTTEMGVVPVECQQWMVKTFFPQAISLGLKKASIINARDIFAMTAVKNVLSKVSDSVEVEVFDSREKAIDWVEVV